MEQATETSADAELLAAVVDVLDRSLRALAGAGAPVDANRLAARAWSVLRHDAPAHAERLNRTMHYLARREADLHPSPVSRRASALTPRAT
jgi:hypothetical protein